MARWICTCNIRIQGPKEANWLPAPTGKFNLMLRLYWPKETPPSIIDGTWKPPAVQQVP